MKPIVWRSILLVLLGAVVAPVAWADHEYHRGHHHRGVGVYVGVPWPGYYDIYPRYYYPYSPYPPLVVVPAAPPVYIEKEPPAASPEASYWYFCGSPQGYYPYVTECPAGWQRVAPVPQAAPK